MTTFGQVRFYIYKPSCGSDVGKTYQRTQSCRRHHWHYAKYRCFRFFLIAPELLFRYFNMILVSDVTIKKTKEHYQLRDTTAVRMFTNASLIQQSIIKHCGGNPLSLKEIKLMNIAYICRFQIMQNKIFFFVIQKEQLNLKKIFLQRVATSISEKSIWDV